MSEKQTQKNNLPFQRIDKPWGYEIIWAHTKDYVAKILFVKKGESLSLQYHLKKEETMYFESGKCLVESGPAEDKLTKAVFESGGIFHIPPHTLHRLTAEEDTRIFEVSTPFLDDVVRLKDRYGRAGK